MPLENTQNLKKQARWLMVMTQVCGNTDLCSRATVRHIRDVMENTMRDILPHTTGMKKTWTAPRVEVTSSYNHHLTVLQLLFLHFFSFLSGCWPSRAPTQKFQAGLASHGERFLWYAVQKENNYKHDIYVPSQAIIHTAKIDFSM